MKYTIEQVLNSPCPHGRLMKDCPTLWCESRVEDLMSGDYEPNLPEVPEGGDAHGADS